MTGCKTASLKRAGTNPSLKDRLIILTKTGKSQAEGRDWRSQMDDFLMYRSTPYSTTRLSPAEMLFGRRIRIKLPQLQEFTCEETATVRERRKERCMQTAEEMHAKITFEKVASVLLRQERDKTLSTPFKKVPFTIVQKNGNSVSLRLMVCIQCQRNLTYGKSYLEREVLKPEVKSSDATGDRSDS